MLDQAFDPDTGLIQSQWAGPVTGPNWGATASGTTLNWGYPAPNTWGGPVASFGYAFDPIGRLVARADHDQGFNELYCYDALNRLTRSATSQAGGAPVTSCLDTGAGITSKTVAYDLVSNITAKSDVGTYNYDTSSGILRHAIQSVTGVADGLTNPVFQYDANGNLTCMSTGAGCSGTVGRQVTYTAFNMTATVTDTGTSQSLTYDSEHFRIRQSSTISGTTTVTDYLNDPASGAMSQRVTVL